MNIGLVAYNSKKDLMANFCIAYRSILEKHQVYATGSTGRVVEDATNLRIHKYLSGPLGGLEQLKVHIASNEMDLVLLFHDTEQPELNDSLMQLLTLCDAHNVPIATNLATAEMLILGLDSGHLDWRDLYR